MPIRCDQYNHVSVMAVEGDLSAENCGQFRRALEEKIDGRQIADFVVDLEKCPFIDSEGLETLLWAKRRCEDLFGQVKLVNLDETCRKIMEITRLDHRFECQQDLATALKTMR